MSSALANLKTTYERTKSKILAKGEGDQEDREYFDEKEKALFFEQVMLRLNKRSKRSLDLFAGIPEGQEGDMSKLQNEITTDIGSMYPSDDHLHTTVALIKEASSNGEINRQKMTERMERNSLHPVDEYCASFRELKKRTDEYSVRRTDMERHRAEVAKLQDKGAASAQKLPVAEEKYKAAVQRYDEMRDELMNDLPALNNDRNTIVGFMLACSLKSQAAYYSDLAEKYSVVNALVGNIDEKSVLNHGKVITPFDRSAAATNLRAHPVFIKGDQAKGRPHSPPQSHTQPAHAQPQQPVQAQYSLHKQTTPTTTTTTPLTTPTNAPMTTTGPITTTIPATPMHSIYTQEYASITAIPPSAPVSEVSPAPPKLSKAQAMYDFNATEDNELSFRKGDTITVIAKQHGDWWEGELNGVAGLFPSNYVKEL